MSTVENPADIPTRDISVEEFYGPRFLSEKDYQFACFESQGSLLDLKCLEEFKTFLTIAREPSIAHCLASHRSVGSLYSSFHRIIRILEHVVTFIRQGNHSHVGAGTQRIVYRGLQESMFEEELRELRTSRPCPKGPLVRYAPFLDKEGVLQ